MQDPDEGLKLWLKKLSENDKEFTGGKNLKHGTVITFKPTGWRGFLPTKWAMGPSSTDTGIA